MTKGIALNFKEGRVNVVIEAGAEDGAEAGTEDDYEIVDCGEVAT